MRDSTFTVTARLAAALLLAAGLLGTLPGGALAQEKGALTAPKDATKAPESPKAPHRRWQDLPKKELRSFSPARPEVVTLANGLRVFLLEDHELPTIDLVCNFRAGSIYEPRAKAGLAGICGEVMRSGGTSAKTGDELDLALEDMAASVEVSIGDWQGRASLSCMKESFDATLAILADVIANPAFREDKLNLAKKQAKSGIARRNDDPSGIARREFSRLLYGDASPYGWTTEVATIDAITRDDLVQFHKQFLAGLADRTTIGVVGDFDAAGMKAKLEKAFGAWKKAEGALPAAPVVGDGPAPKVYLCRKQDVNQATIVMGHLGEQRRADDPDYAALVVLNDILGGGGFASRLLQRVRTEMGLAYGAGSRWNAPYSHKGSFTLSCQTKSESTVKAAQALKKQLELVCSEPVTAEELRVSKESILQSLVFENDSRAEVIERALRYDYFGFPADYLETFQAGIAKVTAEDCLRVAKKHLSPARLVTVVVGDDRAFDAPLSTLGEVVELDYKKAAVEAAPAKDGAAGKGAEKAAAISPEESLAMGKKIVAQAIEERGGRAALEKVKAIRLEGKAQLMTPNGPLPVGMIQTVRFPDAVKLEMRTPMGNMTFGVEGNAGWVSTPQGVGDMPASQLEERKKNVTEDEIPLLLGLAKADGKPLFEGKEKVGEEELSVVRVSETSRLYFDAKGALVRRTEKTAEGVVTAEWSDFTVVEGVKFPKKSRSLLGDEESFTLALDKIEVNPELPAETFQKPAGGAMKPGRPSGRRAQGGEGGAAPSGGEGAQGGEKGEKKGSDN